MMPAPDLSQYRPCVGIMLLNRDKNVFVGRRSDATTYLDVWQMPQGGIDEGEDPETALWREMQEEIGTNNATIIARTDEWLTYDLPDELQGKLWGGDYIGQKQKWFILQFEGQDSEIDINAQQPPEFSTWKWIAPKEVPDVIVPFKKALYEKVLAAFSLHLT